MSKKRPDIRRRKSVRFADDAVTRLKAACFQLERAIDNLEEGASLGTLPKTYTREEWRYIEAQLGKILAQVQEVKRNAAARKRIMRTNGKL